MHTAQKMLSEAVAAANPFELLIIDSDMPVADGFSLVRWIKTQKGMSCKIIMMLTSLRNRSQVDLNDLNVKGIVTKPVRPSDLLDAIIGVSGMRDTVQSVVMDNVNTATDTKADALSILVAEDTLFNQKFIRRLLDRWGHGCSDAGNGRV